MNVYKWLKARLDDWILRGFLTLSGNGGWDYRVMQKNNADGDVGFVEVYYDKRHNIRGYTANLVEPVACCKHSLQHYVELALKQPTLNEFQLECEHEEEQERRKTVVIILSAVGGGLLLYLARLLQRR